MIRKNRELLLKDLCARLPYGIKASYYGVEEECETWDKIEGITLDGYVDIGQYSLSIEQIKPYLFPLSSITKEQKDIFDKLWWNTNGLNMAMHAINWLNKNHFDYNRLIEKSLALDATNLNIY